LQDGIKDYQGVEDEFGKLIKFNSTAPQLVAKKLDRILLRNLVIKCRGFLQRKSLKHSKKWQKAFYCIDIN
jgi:hypothetical protein